MITIREIAADADVSVSTVSIVLGRRSDQLKVSAATRKKVLDSAKRLGYCRNLLASQMQSGKTQIFSFLAPSLSIRPWRSAIIFWNRQTHWAFRSPVWIGSRKRQCRWLSFPTPSKEW